MFRRKKKNQPDPHLEDRILAIETYLESSNYSVNAYWNEVEKAWQAVKYPAPFLRWSAGYRHSNPNIHLVKSPTLEGLQKKLCKTYGRHVIVNGCRRV